MNDPKKNLLLHALPDTEWERWEHEVEEVDLPLGKVLYESGSTMSHVYFPTILLQLPAIRRHIRRRTPADAAVPRKL